MSSLKEREQRRKIGVVRLKISGNNGVVQAACHSSALLNDHAFRHAPSTRLHYLHLSYSDLSIHLSKNTLYALINQLNHRPEQNGLTVAFVNIPLSLSNLALSANAQRIMSTPNAGGSSVWSEALSAEVLYRLVGATVVKTEMELTYCSRGSPITDYACQINGVLLGVSVTRAMAFNRALKKQDVTRLLTKKLLGINISSTTVTNCDFTRQILHVWTRSGRDAAIVKKIWLKLSPCIRSNTILLVTSANCPLLFFEKQSVAKKVRLK